MKKSVKLVALLMVAVMMLTLFASCKKDDTDDSDMPAYVYNATYTKMAEVTDGWPDKIVKGEDCVWVAAYVADGEYEESYTWTDNNGEVYEESYINTNYVVKIYKVDSDGTTVTPLSNYTFNSREFDQSGMEDGKYKEVYAGFNGITPYGNSVAVLTYVYTTVYNVPSDFDESSDYYYNYDSDYTRQYFINILDESGNVTEQKEITSLVDEDGFSFFTQDDEGNWYFGSWSGFTVVAPDLTTVIYKSDDTDTNYEKFEKIPDGRIAVLSWESDGYTVRPFDVKNKELGEAISLPSNMYNFIAGTDGYILFARNSNGISGIKEDGTIESLVNWLDSDMDSSEINEIIALDNGDFICCNNSWDDETGEQKIEVIKLTKTPYDSSSERKIITIATMSLNYRLRQRVLEYNRTNTEYRIRVNDYSQYITADDTNAAVTKLNTEIVAGNVPDIFIANSSMPITQYSGKGILEDLTPYMERDFGEDAFVEDFFKTLRDEDGKLYEIYPSFYVSTVGALKSVVGDTETMSFADIQQALSGLKDDATAFENTYSRDYAIESIIYGNMGSFVNWKTGECSFNSQEFIDLIEFIKTFKTQEEVDQIYDDPDYDWGVNTYEKIMSGEQLFFTTELSDFNSFRGSTFYTYNNDISFVGFPGIGNAFGFGDSGYALSAKSENKEAAWEFISYVLTEDYQRDNIYYYLPTNKTVFEEKMLEAKTPDFSTAEENPDTDDEVDDDYGISYSAAAEVGTDYYADEWYSVSDYNTGAVDENGVRENPKTYIWLSGGEYGNGIDIAVFAMTDEEEAVIRNLISSTTVFARYDTSLADIISEELAAFFNGQKSSADAAAMIQSRATIYVNEQR